MPKVHFVKKAAKDNPAVKKGESYYWWKFRFQGKRYSATRPKRWQLTTSSFLSQIWQVEDNLPGSMEQCDVEYLISDLEMIRDECQDNLENMPEALQETSDAGILLQERIDALDSWISELENIDYEELQETDGGSAPLGELIAEAVNEGNPGEW